MDYMNVTDLLLQHKIIAIIRGAKPADVDAIADALLNGGIRALEITLNSDNALGLIERLAGRLKGSMLVGAGTVLNAAAALDAIQAGAQFIISPSLDVETIAATKAGGIVSIPGAFTATEIVKAHQAGADIVKVFPAQEPKYIKDLRGPLGHIWLMPTGGVTLDNIQAFQMAGAVAFGVGTALVDSSKTVNAAYLLALTEKARAFSAALQGL
jgi:2-dehydro-3-deoxyphosphogluconate aldolase / (4S)-4-hydroxy-2-oxoglutarate aldolase